MQVVNVGLLKSKPKEAGLFNGCDIQLVDKRARDRPGGAKGLQKCV